MGGMRNSTVTKIDGCIDPDIIHAPSLKDLKHGDRFVVAGVTSVFTCTGFRTARTDDGELTVWTYDAECDLYDPPA